MTKGLLHEDLIQAQLKRMFYSSFRSKEYSMLYLDNLRFKQIYWKTGWLHTSEIIIRETNDGPLFLVGFRGIESYSPLVVIRQFGGATIP